MPFCLKTGVIGMGKIEEGIKELISERFGSIPKFASAIGIPAQTIYSALRNGIAGASATTFMPIADALDIDPVKLVKGELSVHDPFPPGSVSVPLFGTIDAGQPADPDYVENSYPIPAEVHNRWPRAFLLGVEGESMNRVLPNGCYALVDPCDAVEQSNCPYAIAIGDNTAMIKRVVLLDNGFELRPDSHDPTFRSTVLDFGSPDSKPVSVIGRVVWYCLPARWSFESR